MTDVTCQLCLLPFDRPNDWPRARVCAACLAAEAGLSEQHWRLIHRRPALPGWVLARLAGLAPLCGMRSGCELSAAEASVLVLPGLVRASINERGAAHDAQISDVGLRFLRARFDELEPAGQAALVQHDTTCEVCEPRRYVMVRLHSDKALARLRLLLGELPTYKDSRGLRLYLLPLAEEARALRIASVARARIGGHKGIKPNDVELVAATSSGSRALNAEALARLAVWQAQVIDRSTRADWSAGMTDTPGNTTDPDSRTGDDRKRPYPPRRS